MELYRIDLTGSFDIGANDSWEELFQEAKDEGLLVPVDLDPVTQWCFAHQEDVFIEVGTANLICSKYRRSPCDIAEAAVVRMEDSDGS